MRALHVSSICATYPGVPREQDFDGHRAPATRERVSLLAGVAEYVDAWQRAMGAEPRPSGARIHELNQRAVELQQRSVSADRKSTR